MSNYSPYETLLIKCNELKKTEIYSIQNDFISTAIAINPKLDPVSAEMLFKDLRNDINSKAQYIKDLSCVKDVVMTVVRWATEFPSTGKDDYYLLPVGGKIVPMLSAYGKAKLCRSYNLDFHIIDVISVTENDKLVREQSSQRYFVEKDFLSTSHKNIAVVVNYMTDGIPKQYIYTKADKQRNIEVTNAGIRKGNNHYKIVPAKKEDEYWDKGVWEIKALQVVYDKILANAGIKPDTDAKMLYEHKNYLSKLSDAEVVITSSEEAFAITEPIKIESDE